MNIKLDIPASFFQGEERCGYYVSPEIKKVWAVQLDLIAEFARICEKHGIKWWMDAGTLLGAVRHKGFIPWDDDVDVIMMREDYERFCRIAPEELSYPYSLQKEEYGREGRLTPIAKIYNVSTTMGATAIKEHFDAGKKLTLGYKPAVFLDLFPLDGIPDNEHEAGELCSKLNYLYTTAIYYVVKCRKFNGLADDYRPAQKLWKRPLKALIHHTLNAIKATTGTDIIGNIQQKHMAESMKYFAEFMSMIRTVNYPNSKRIAKLVHAHDTQFMTRRIWERSLFDSTIYLPFEILTLPAPSGYIDILDHFYGNWHEYFIRYRHADFYDTERPYTYYVNEEEYANEDGA